VGTVIKNVDKEFMNCRQLDEDNLYMLLYQGIKSLNKFLCLNDKVNKSKIHYFFIIISVKGLAFFVLFTLEVNKHHMCYKELHEEFVDCEGPPDWFEHRNETKICE